MPNHFHLIIQTGAKPLSDLMRGLLTGYALYFNRRHKRRGYLYQNRYKSILCQKDIYLLELVRYVHLNPIRAGMVRDLNALRRYPWSGNSTLVGRAQRMWQNTDDILGYFSKHRGTAIRKYEDFIRDGLHMGKRDDLVGGGLRRSAGGWGGVWDLKISKEYWRGDARVLGESHFVETAIKSADEEIERKEKLKMNGWNLEKLAHHVYDVFSVEIEDVRKKVRAKERSVAKAVFSFWGIKELGLSSREMGKFLRCSRAGLTQLVKKGEALAKDYNVKLLS